MKHKSVGYTTVFKSYKSGEPLRPGASDYKSLPSVDTGNNDTSAPRHTQYTGDKLIGIATMHKSSSVPVMRGSEMVVATARMRRG